MKFDRTQAFDNISQRILFGYQFAFSDFAEVPSGLADEGAQRAAHRLMRSIIDALYGDPSLLDLPLNEDDSYDLFVCNNQRPELNAIYLSTFKKLHEFYKFLHAAALVGVIQSDQLIAGKAELKAHKAAYKPAYARLLDAVGFDVDHGKETVVLWHREVETLPGLKLLAAVPFDRTPELAHGCDVNPLFEFIRGCFDGRFVYLYDRLDALYGYDGLMVRLRDRCLNEGYKELLHVDAGANFSFCLMLKKNVGGFRIGYNPRKRCRFYFATLNGVGEKAMLEDFDHLSHNMQRHFIEICRPCSDCLGCTKGGKAKPYTVTAHFEGRDYRLCPQFPQHDWEEFTPERIETLLEYNDLQEQYGQ